MNNQEILDNAPPNTLIVDREFKFFDDIYCELNEQGEWKWNTTMPKFPVRSILDIKRIVELDKSCDTLVNVNFSLTGDVLKLEKRIAELEEAMNDIVEAVLDNRSKQVTGKTLTVIRAAIDKFDLRRDYKGGAE
jgi:hypothetical protein